MKKIITPEDLVSYSQCPYKAYLLLCTRKRGTHHEYMQILEKQRKDIQRQYINGLRQENDDVQPYSVENFKGKHKFLINATLEADEVSAKCAILSKVRTHSIFGHYSYEPTIVVSSRSVKKEHRLEIFFVSHVLERVQGKRPVTGCIVGLDGKSHRVKLENGPRALIPFLEPLREWAIEDNPEPPSLILNKHCPICRFHDLCRKKVTQEDNLSLLDGISTQKAINRYERKGIFTIKQLSYTFRPRKRRKRTKNPPPTIHKPELQALAIREQKIYLQELPELTRQPVELFLDIEGVPDQQFYYLIGLLVSENEAATYHPFWADISDDEAQIWGQFLEKTNQYPDAPIYHYGNYDARALAKLGRRYDTEIESLLERLVNVNKHIYGKVYFPIYSNRLKEIGAFIGATWTAPNASGLQSLVWRHQWEKTLSAEYKDLLLTYNYEDCSAVKGLVDNLSKIKLPSDILSEIDLADHRMKDITESSQMLQHQFTKILMFSYFDYDKKKINFRIESKRQGSRKGGARPLKKRPSPTKIIEVSQGQICPKCKTKTLRPNNKISKRLIIDLVLTKNGIRKSITEYKGFYDYCCKCYKIYSPPVIREFGKRQVYGHGFKAWLVYHRVALRLPYDSIIASLKEHFEQELNAGRIAVFIKDFARYYVETEHKLIQMVQENPFIHVDETTISIQGVNWYVWVFTDGKHVVLKLQETREATLVHELLNNYKGVLISDFFSGYDSVNCRQQKCWVHLIGDLNNDLRESPFDTEYENFVSEVRNLFIPIMETVQMYGLKTRNLNKFRKSVEKFYNKVIIDRLYKSELTSKYQKRFKRYRESLFTFLELDGIPWHNNEAERALRHIAKQRVISTSFQEKSTHNYLVLLSIYQTCRFQGKSFFKFLFSGETNLDQFEARKRKRRT